MISSISLISNGTEIKHSRKWRQITIIKRSLRSHFCICVNLRRRSNVLITEATSTRALWNKKICSVSETKFTPLSKVIKHIISLLPIYCHPNLRYNDKPYLAKPARNMRIHVYRILLSTSCREIASNNIRFFFNFLYNLIDTTFVHIHYTLFCRPG